MSGQYEVCPDAPQHPDGEHALPDQHHQEGGDGGMAQQEEAFSRSVDIPPNLHIEDFQFIDSKPKNGEEMAISRVWKDLYKMLIKVIIQH